MALKLTEAFMLKNSALAHDQVLDHLRDILKRFLVQTDATRFYIGMTGDLEQRRQQHERNKPEFTLMCVIHGEDPHMASGINLDDLEAQAIARFRSGMTNPSNGKMLRCTNTQSGAPQKQWLYLLLDLKDASRIPTTSTQAYGPPLRT